jgi:hypothetical protein
MATGTGLCRFRSALHLPTGAHGHNGPGSCNLYVSTTTASDSRVSTSTCAPAPNVFAATGPLGSGAFARGVEPLPGYEPTVAGSCEATQSRC